MKNIPSQLLLSSLNYRHQFERRFIHFGLPTLQSQVTSVITFAGKPLTFKAVFSYDRNRWRVIRMYILPTV